MDYYNTIFQDLLEENDTQLNMQDTLYSGEMDYHTNNFLNFFNLFNLFDIFNFFNLFDLSNIFILLILFDLFNIFNFRIIINIGEFYLEF